MVNSINSTTGISSYPQSFQDLVQKPQGSLAQSTQQQSENGDKVNLSKKSKAKKVALGVGIAAAAVLTLSTIAYRVKPKFFTDLLDKENFVAKIAKGVDKVGEFISDIPANISSLFSRKVPAVEDAAADASKA